MDEPTKELQKILEQRISKLPDLEAKVLKLHYGLDTGRALPVEEVAAALGLSAEGVKELETVALRNMRRV